MSKSVSETSLSAEIFRYLRYHLRGRRGLIAASTALAIPALWFGWPWLVAAGLAPLLIALAPCALMCAVGLCMRGGSGTNAGQASGCTKSQSADDAAAPTKALASEATDINEASVVSGRFSENAPQSESISDVQKVVPIGKILNQDTKEKVR